MAKVLGAIVHFSPAQIKQVLENEDKIETAAVSDVDSTKLYVLMLMT